VTWLRKTPVVFAPTRLGVEPRTFSIYGVGGLANLGPPPLTTGPLSLSRGGGWCWENGDGGIISLGRDEGLGTLMAGWLDGMVGRQSAMFVQVQ
jgi:hypothetical protein